MSAILMALAVAVSLGIGVLDGRKYSFSKQTNRDFPYSWRVFDTRARISLTSLFAERAGISLLTSLSLIIVLLPFLVPIEFDPELGEFIRQEYDMEVNFLFPTALCFFGYIISSNLIVARRWRKEKQYRPN